MQWKIQSSAAIIDRARTSITISTILLLHRQFSIDIILSLYTTYIGIIRTNIIQSTIDHTGNLLPDVLRSYVLRSGSIAHADYTSCSEHVRAVDETQFIILDARPIRHIRIRRRGY